MLPPIPQSLVPIAAHQDVPKPRPEIPPVTPAQETAGEDKVMLDKRHPQEVHERWREEQRRRQRKGYTPEEMANEEPEDLPEATPRQGLWVDVEV